jgi:hypothetical protein
MISLLLNTDWGKKNIALAFLLGVIGDICLVLTIVSAFSSCSSTDEYVMRLTPNDPQCYAIRTGRDQRPQYWMCPKGDEKRPKRRN